MHSAMIVQIPYTFPVTFSGSVPTSGTTITWLSGTVPASAWVGHTITSPSILPAGTTVTGVTSSTVNISQGAVFVTSGATFTVS